MLIIIKKKNMITTHKLRKMAKATDNIERKVEDARKTGGRICTVSMVILGILIALWISYATYYWHEHNRIVWQSPIILQMPLYVEDRSLKHVSVLHSPIPLESTTGAKLKPTTRVISKKVVITDEDIIRANKHGDILWKIYGLETTWGKADYCRLNNLGFGGFGVLNAGKIVCYKTFSEAVERAEYWLVKNGVDDNLAVALCRWNIGINTSNCKYYQDYLALN